jgi:hypothetical protein
VTSAPGSAQVPCNSVGNLLLHLAGNTTQWILAAFGAVLDERDRKAEFAAEGGVPAQELLLHLGSVWTRACDVVDRVPVAELLRVRRVQRYRRERPRGDPARARTLLGPRRPDLCVDQAGHRSDLRFYDL